MLGDPHHGQAAESGIILPPSGAGSPPAAAGAANTPSSPPSSDALEPVQRIQEFHAVREEPAVNISMVSQSPTMQEVFRRIERVLHTTATVLITEESGTGKGLIARIIHNQGSLRQGPFIAVSCAAIPERLLEAELFSHIELAAGGTLFVDGVGEMSPALPAKLWRVLQESGLSGSAARRPCRPMPESSRRPPQGSNSSSPRGDFGATSSTASTSTPSPCLPCGSDGKTSSPGGAFPQPLRPGASEGGGWAIRGRQRATPRLCMARQRPRAHAGDGTGGASVSGPGGDRRGPPAGAADARQLTVTADQGCS
jgi:hypothetical protein